MLNTSETYYSQNYPGINKPGPSYEDLDEPERPLETVNIYFVETVKLC